MDNPKPEYHKPTPEELEEMRDDDIAYLDNEVDLRMVTRGLSAVDVAWTWNPYAAAEWRERNPDSLTDEELQALTDLVIDAAEFIRRKSFDRSLPSPRVAHIAFVIASRLAAVAREEQQLEELVNERLREVPETDWPDTPSHPST
jgi:hypothetical protein